MKEVLFLKQNAEKWKQFEALLSFKGNKNPDHLSDLFIQLTDDLSYSKTFYPNSKTTEYLNSLASKVHQAIYINKVEEKGKIKYFWFTEAPLIFYKNRKTILVSFLIFIISMLIGIISTQYDDSFVRLILGDSYVNMTLDNIEKGDPMAVYKKMNQVDMLFGITFNNIRVSFNAFAGGLLFSLGTALILFFNGIMVGAFQYFFYKQDLFFDSFLVIWIHGTIEITSIVIAGAAGFVLGNSIIFPGTYSRKDSFIRGSVEGVKILVSLIPFFIIAGILESFVTRYTGMNILLSISIIGLSFILVIWYFIIYPHKLNNKLELS